MLELADRPALQAGDLSRSSGSDPRRGHSYFTIGIIGTKHMPKQAKKPKKRGPKETRLIIVEDPEQALAKLLRPAKKAR